MSTPLAEEYLAEIAARAAAASEGPWWVDNDSPDLCRWVAGKSPLVEINFGYRGNSNLPDAEFTAHAREDVPALLAEVDRLRALLSPVPRLAKVRVRPVPSGGWRVRFRLDGKRKSSGVFETHDAAVEYTKTLKQRIGGAL